MNKLRALTLVLIAIGTVGSLSATPRIVVSGVRELDDDAFLPTSSITILGSSTIVNGDAMQSADEGLLSATHFDNYRHDCSSGTRRE